jgi:hypothetical protein
MSGWFVRSLADHDTHRDIYSPATRSVHARCGIEFQPLPIGLHGNRIAFSGPPPDPTKFAALANGHHTVSETVRPLASLLVTHLSLARPSHDVS